MDKHFDAICGSKLWNPKLVHSEHPDFTTCFQQTFVLWAPCAVVWFVAPLWTYMLTRKVERKIKVSWLHVLKILTTLALIAIEVYNLTQAFLLDLYPVYYMTPLILIVTYVICLAFVHFERIRGLRSSTLLFTFWFLLVSTTIITARSKILRYLHDPVKPSMIDLAVFYSFFTLIIINTVWFSFSEKATEIGVASYEEDEEEENGEKKQRAKKYPEEAVSLPSRLTFWWLSGIIYTGYKRDIVREDLWELDKSELSGYLTKKFESNWTKKAQSYIKRKRAEEEEVSIRGGAKTTYRSSDGKNEEQVNLNDDGTPEVKVKSAKKLEEPSLVWTLVQVFGGKFIAGSFIKLVHDILLFAGPILLNKLIGFVKDKDQDLSVGIFYTFLIFYTAFIQSFALQHYFHRMFIVGGRIRTAIMNAIYNKSLNLSTTARKQSTVGEMTNLLSVNAQMLADLITYLNTVWSAPFQIAVTMVMLWQYLGVAALAGLATMIAFIPMNIVIGSKTKKYQSAKLKVQDSRIKLTNEVLSGIKIIKFYGWEPSFRDIVGKIRDKEMSVLRKMAFLTVSVAFSWSCAPFVVSAVSFATYVLINDKNTLDASTAFVSISLFNILRFPLVVLPSVITQLIAAKVSIERIRTFLLRDELNKDTVIYNAGEAMPGVAVKLVNANLSWGETDVNLKNLNLEVKKGNLVAIVGAVGSGKSSLLSGIIGEMKKLNEDGKIYINGSTAFVPQQAWIKNATVKENILFGSPYNETNYNRVLNACSLITDLTIMPAGDRTEIGEKGINLSGGQKQRVSLARSVYSNAEIYMLDDPLSAVDSHVGKHIFDSVIGPNGMLKNKTRLFVTNSLNFLNQVDEIVMIEDGAIVQIGSYDELKANENAPFAKFIKNYLISHEKKELEKEELDASSLSEKDGGDAVKSPLKSQKSVDAKSPPKPDPEKPKLGEKITVKEKIESGNVKLSTILEYLKACNIWLTIVFLTVFALSHVAQIASSVWLSIWSNDKANESNKYMRLGVYVALGFIQCLITLGADFLYLGMFFASIKTMHDRMLVSILKSTMEFFESTPTGRIINRFSKDIDAVERSVPEAFRSWLRCLFHVLSTLILISASTPLFIVALIPIIIIYVLVQRFFVASMRQLKRLDSASKSPIFSHFNETLTGVSTIRAYRAQDRFTKMMEHHVDENLKFYYPNNIANRWLALRLELLGNLITVFASLFAVLSRNSISAGLAGLSISYSLNISQTLNWLVRMSSDFEANIVSVERIKEYCETPHEADWTVANKRPSQTWPSEGRIRFENFSVRYREELENVLKDLTFDVKAGEKIGIVGRTGAGKSSLSLCLFRLLERSTGKIYIDDVDIKEIGLHDLRHKLSIIPQDPVLFSGTLRMNLDPFEKHTDEQIWNALEHAHLKQFVTGLDKKLDYECSEGGENLSVGQRQLVCLARALLRKSKILLLDEATAAVDHNTDDLIQSTIRSQFGDCTILTVAHRLNTIIDSSRILVLDKGKIVEFDTPKTLLAKKNGAFASMARDAGLI